MPISETVEAVSSPSPFAEERFADGDGWIELHRDDRFTQRYRIEGKRLFTESVATIAAAPDAVRDMLLGCWDWWEGGRYENRTELSDGRIRYDLWPVGKLRGVHVVEYMHAAAPLEDGGWRIRLDLERHLSGVAYFDVRPDAADGTRLHGRFAGPEIRGLLPHVLGPKRFAINHLLAERGALAFPFPRGTGWLGLIRRLEG